MLIVKTSIKGWFSGSGTDANIFIINYDQSGIKSPVIKLKNEGKTFDSGKEDKFKVSTNSIMTSIQKIFFFFCVKYLIMKLIQLTLKY